uniref:Major facilitator superfamily (MFS) profile domain-containing protein n=1 Tax=Electrophorus electricus TaxID=8005 RepID=A0A4W4G813_ELEEL
MTNAVTASRAYSRTFPSFLFAARKQFQQEDTPAFVHVLAVFSALGGFLFGYDTGVMSGAMLLLKREKNLTVLWQELLVSSAAAAAALSALAGGFLNGVFGRRVCVLLASFVFFVGGIVLSSAPNKEALLIGRILIGLGLGIGSMTVPVYIAESSPPHLRGQLVTINALFVTAGQFVASLIDGAFSYVRHGGWRYMLGLSALPALVQFLGFLFLPESPRWLIQKGLTQKARRVLSQIRGSQNIDEEYDSIKSSIEEEEKDCGGGRPVLWSMLSHPPARRALIVGCGLQMFQQLSGINTVILCLLAVGFLLSAQHSPPVTLHPSEPSLANSSCTSYLSCEPCMLDPRCGFCYQQNSTAVFASSCVPVNLASSDRASWGRCSNSTEAADPNLWAYNFCPTSFSWLVLLGLILYLAFFAPGMGSMPWTINSEIYPLWARSTGNACSAGVNWTFNVLVSLTFLHVAQYLTYYGAFFLYSSLALLGVFFIYGCLPETKGRRLEEIESLFESRLCSCGASDSDEGRQVEYIRVKGSNYHLSDNDASDVE